MVAKLHARPTSDPMAHRDITGHRTLLETAMDGFWLVDTGGRLLEVNETYCRMSGYSQQELLKMRISDLESTEASEATAEHIRRVMIRGEDRFETRHRRKDGSGFDVEVSVQYRPESGGRLVAFLRDITLRKDAEARLRETELRFRHLVDATDGIVWEADAQTFAFTSISRNAERILGYPVADWFESGFWAAHIHPDDRDEAIQYCAACTGRLANHEFEYRFMARDGRVLWLRDSVKVIPEGNRPRWLRGLMVDITERRLAEQRRAEIEEQLLQSQKLEAIGALAGGIAHDLNNILTGITGFASLARQAMGRPEEQLSCFDEIDQAGHRAAQLVQQILTFSRAGGHQFAPVAMSQTVAEVVGLLRATLAKNIEFDVSSVPDLPKVLGNASQIHQIVMNLGTNAAYAMRENGGRLGIRLDTCAVDDPLAFGLPDLLPGTHVRLTVSDTGCGMDPATRSRVFEPFFTTKPPGEGHGLGLAVIHGIVRSHHGAVRLVSEVGRGSTFEVYLPATRDAAREEGAPPTVAPGRGERVLFVDDEPMLVALGRRQLRALGYAAECESDVAKALMRIRDNPAAFDLVITDQSMPVMTGLQFAARIHELRPDLPVVLISGYASNLTPEQTRAAGVAEILTKPYTQPSLAQVVRRNLRRPRQD